MPYLVHDLGRHEYVVEVYPECASEARHAHNYSVRFRANMVLCAGIPFHRNPVSQKEYTCSQKWPSVPFARRYHERIAFGGFSIGWPYP